MRIFIIVLISFLVVLSVAAQDEDVMVTDGLQHNVSLAEIIFDDFDSATRALRYTDASEADIERLRDRIAPLCHGEIAECLTPEYEPAEDADRWLSPRSPVIGYVAEDGQAYAYAFKILNFHEIVNDTLADVPLVITYCPLCNSAVVFSRILNGEEIILGNTSALYQSDMVMYDIQTGSYWMQAEGKGILGENTNEFLDILPFAITTWEEWKANHPQTLSLVRPNNLIDYARDPFANYAGFVNSGRFAFPVSEDILQDTRLNFGDNVLVVTVEGESVAYPIAEFGNAATVDTVNGEEIVVLSLENGVTAAAYFTTLDDGTGVDLTYDIGAWLDTVSDSRFDLTGRAISGTLEGTQLQAVPSRFMFWFAAVATTPDLMVYEG